MKITNQYRRVPCLEIRVARNDRQRREFTTDDIDASIAKYGVLIPIIVDREHNLIAGERRLASSIKRGIFDIPVRYFDELSPHEAQIIELIENVQRLALPWRDQALAIARLHRMFCAEDAEWTQAKTGEQVHLTQHHISNYVRVAENLDSPMLAEAPTLKAALNILDRRKDRAVADAMSDLLDATAQDIEALRSAPPAPPGGAPSANVIQMAPAAPRQALAQPSAESSILNEDFLEWAPRYSGPKFNFIHCDFPYGINIFDGAWSGRRSHTGYDDSSDVYWKLLRGLCSNLDRIMSASGHLMFWFSMDYYTETLETFQHLAPSLNVQVFPLYWHKTDNAGIMPDPQRGPRRVVETALIASREDRLLVKSVSNCYGAPTDKRYHPHTKPEPVLRHFFQMFVDDNTRMLDPTCGGGSALRAAEDLGAQVLGLEASAEHCDSARIALKNFRTMARIK